jgi:hypothetical protein
MFFVIFGTKGKVDFAGVHMDKCASCEKRSAISVFDAKRYFTLFFIPVFPYSRESFWKCNNCGRDGKLEKEERDKIGDKLMDEEEFLKKHKDELEKQADEKKKLAEKFLKFVAKESKKKPKKAKSRNK